MKTIGMTVLSVACAGLVWAAEPEKQPAPASPAAESAPGAGAPSSLKTVTPSSISVSRGAVCTAISDREPVGALEEGKPAEFNADVSKVYFWTEVKPSNPPAVIRHIWFLDRKQVAEIKLNAKFERSRIWSSKTVAAGAWKVQAVDEAGSILKSAEFKVK